MYGQATFYHNGHEVFQDHKNYLTDLQFKLQTVSGIIFVVDKYIILSG